MSTSSRTISHPWLVDSHVHLYKCFRIEEFLESAYQNLQLMASNLKQGSNFSGISLLTECRVDEVFEQLLRRVGQPSDPADPVWRGWHFHAVPEDPTRLLAEHSTLGRLWIVAGRQVATAENLEVLALLTSSRFADGQPLETTLQAIHSCGAIPVIPWGAGKGWGHRGRLLSQLLSGRIPRPLYLGDNGSRPGLWYKPHHFREAAQVDVPILPGSDPLPLPWEVRRVGSRGFILDASSPPSAPGAELRARLQAPTGQPIRPFGGPLGNGRFIFNQIALRMNKQHSTQRLANA